MRVGGAGVPGLRRASTAATIRSQRAPAKPNTSRWRRRRRAPARREAAPARGRAWSARWRAGIARRGGRLVHGHLFHLAHDEHRAERDRQLVDAPLEQLAHLGAQRRGRQATRPPDRPRTRPRHARPPRTRAWESPGVRDVTSADASAPGSTTMRVSHVPSCAVAPELADVPVRVDVGVLQRRPRRPRRLAGWPGRRGRGARCAGASAVRRRPRRGARCGRQGRDQRRQVRTSAWGSIQSDARHAAGVPGYQKKPQITQIPQILLVSLPRSIGESVQSADASVDGRSARDSVTA